MRSAAIRLSEVREQINQGALDSMPKEQLESLRERSPFRPRERVPGSEILQ